jgi:hypothetical protein
MKLTLRNKTKYDVSDTSTKYSIVFVVTKYSELDKIKPNLTEDNFKGAMLGEERLENIIPKHMVIDDSFEENIVMAVKCEEKPAVDVLAEQVAELQEVVADLGGM